MKNIFVIIFIIFNIVFTYGQDIIDCHFEDYGIPFEIKDDPNIRITFAKNTFSIGVRGIAFVPVIVNEQGNLIKYCVNIIRIHDSTNNNLLSFSDSSYNLDRIEGTSENVDIVKYPYYIRFIVEEIYRKVKLIKFVSPKKISGEKYFHFSIIFKIE